MEIGHTYATPYGQMAMIWASEEFTPPERITLSMDGVEVGFSRIEPRSIYCDDVPGVPGHCNNADCHRKPLGVCGCGRHHGKQPFVRAVR
ncbi:hypothetical protein QT381_02660 [Galbitalea sp. SE-J8]|uniref:hypothetical protein n=1 Tax=Galbitalea sp. SE-J8 TaxID=3054952 RepID=UPI00259C8A46|nr:hypothetical protein [Galbitalea sp. SE-J8]MDM4761905.1 hypothetical protein [Galbitalea sp. SE-J8]